MKIVFEWFIIAATIAGGGEAPGLPALQAELAAYRANLDLLRSEHKKVYPLPALSYFLFGMGNRTKLLYQQGCLKDARNGVVLRRWNVKQEWIVPSAYALAMQLVDGTDVVVFEDDEAVWLWEGARLTALTATPIELPKFADKRFGPILRVLHQEILLNVVDGRPLPNFFVHQKPWRPDAAMTAMVLEKSGNVGLLHAWIRSLRDPFDRNNKGVEEPDNLGQVMYLASLIDRDAPRTPVGRPATEKVPPQTSTGEFHGKTDFADHPVYQAKWAAYGLRRLGRDVPFAIPKKADSYSSLFWWDKENYVPVPRANGNDYPYLAWAEDNFRGEKLAPVGDRDYPLTWEANASEADYAGMRLVSEEYTRRKLCAPHAWHAAEMFLLLWEIPTPPPEDYSPAGNQVVALVRSRFFARAQAADWVVKHQDYAAWTKTSEEFRSRTREILAELNASHTRYVSPDEPEFAGLSAIFRLADGRREVVHDSSGMDVTKDGFVRQIFAGGPADKAGLKRGDRLLTVDGAPFQPVASFRGRAGTKLMMSVERRLGKPPIAVSIVPRRVSPKREWLDALTRGARTEERNGKIVGCLPVFSGVGEEVEQAIRQQFQTTLYNADALILDVRNGWGGADLTFLDLFHPSGVVLTVVQNDGSRSLYSPRWRKPLVVLTNEGSRSAKEVIAFSLQKNHRATLVGTKTGGAVLAGGCFRLLDGGLLYLAVSDVLVDGVRLEGRGVTPDVEVKDALPYANGADPQLEKAFQVAAELAGAKKDAH